MSDTSLKISKKRTKVAKISDNDALDFAQLILDIYKDKKEL